MSPSTPHHTPQSPKAVRSRARSVALASEPVSTPWNVIPPAVARCWDACRAPLLAWFETHARDLPWRAPQNSGPKAGRRDAGPLEKPPEARRPPYAVWVSEIMLQQTVVAAVIPHFERWIRRFPDVRALASAEPEHVLRAWAGLGYYARARNLHKGAQAVVARGAWPEDVAGWRDIPGVGEYTAGAVVSLAFGRPAPILDGNVVRVFSRLLGLNFLPGAGAAEKRAYWALARLWVGSADAAGGASGVAGAPAFRLRGDGLVRPGDLNEALMELGALVCIPAAPRCEACPLAASCASRAHGWTRTLPPAKPRAKMETVAAVAVRAGHRGKLLVEMREPGGFLAGHRVFPLFLNEDALAWRKNFARRFPGIRIGEARPAARVGHTIMAKRYEIEVWDAAVHPAVGASRPPDASRVLTWLPVAELDDALTNALAKKIWKAGG